MRIEIDDVSRLEVLALLEEHLRNMYELSPPEEVFAFDASTSVPRHLSLLSSRRMTREAHDG